jgi:hypothetical protein
MSRKGIAVVYRATNGINYVTEFDSAARYLCWREEVTYIKEILSIKSVFRSLDWRQSFPPFFDYNAWLEDLRRESKFTFKNEVFNNAYQN